MKKKTNIKLLIAVTILLLLYILPFELFNELLGIYTNSEAGAIGIIGGADGPTAIFIAKQLDWVLIFLVGFDIILFILLLFKQFSKTTKE